MFFSEIIKFNTRMMIGSMMLYMLAITAIIAGWLQGGSKKVGISLTVIALFSILSCMIAPTVTDVKFYDTLPVWSAVQSVICIVMIVLLALHFAKGNKSEKMLCAFGILPMLSFILDSFGTGFGLWQGGLISEVVFILIFNYVFDTIFV